MRSGTTGDRVTLNKAVAQPCIRCRRFDAQLETLAHVLGQCTHMNGLVILRRNSIRDFTSTAQKEGYVNGYESKIQDFLHSHNFSSNTTDPTNAFQTKVKNTIKLSRTLIPKDDR
jgi:hypothetical protein